MQDREFDNEFHGQGLPRTGGDVERLEKTVRSVVSNLSTLAGVATLNVFANRVGQARPGVVAANKVDGLCSTRVSSKDRVVVLVQDFGAEGGRNIEMFPMKNKVVENLEVFVACVNCGAPDSIGLKGGFVLSNVRERVNCEGGGNG